METHGKRAVSPLLGSPHDWPDVCNLDQAGGFPMIEQGRVEQRRYPRHRVSWPVVLETDDRISFVETIDISMRGAKLCLRKPLALGSVVNLHIHPEDRAEMHVQAVAWRSDPDGMAFFFIGLAEPLLSQTSLPASSSLELALAG
jgi:hypothetical protein